MANPLSTLTAAVITLNEEQNIGECLGCLTWADELLVVDAQSSDDTASIARKAGARVLPRSFDSFASQRNYAIQEARCTWVFFVDADERVDESLAREVLQAVQHNKGAADHPVGFWVPRRNLILGHWVRHAGWWPDYQMRLFLRGRVHYDERRDPHEVVQVEGSTAYLSHPLLHYNYTSVRELFSKQRIYARREARSLVTEGVQARPHRFITQPTREFFRRYVHLGGYKDGLLGLLLALIMAWYRLQVYLNLRRMG